MEVFSHLCIVREGAGNERPEARRMIRLSQVAELMHHNEVAQVSGQILYAVVEIQVAGSRAAAPPRLLVADSN